MNDGPSVGWLRRAKSSGAYRLVLALSEEKDRVSIGLLNTVLVPGVVARVGLRQVTAWVLRVKAGHFGFAKAAGGHVVVEDRSSPWQRFAIVIAAPLLLLPLGAILSMQLIVDQLTLQSFVPIPSSLDADGYASTLLEVAARFGSEDVLRLWCTVSCWFMMAIPYRDVMAVLTRSDSPEAHRIRSLRWYLRPIAAMSWIGSRLGPLAGVAAVLTGYAATGLFLRLLIGDVAS